MSPHKYGKSYLTIGGYYDYDYKGDLFWYNIRSSEKEWNVDIPSIKLGDSEYYPVSEEGDSRVSFTGKF